MVAIIVLALSGLGLLLAAWALWTTFDPPEGESTGPSERKET